MSALPTIGCIVHYRLSEQDAEKINQRRAVDSGAGNRAVVDQVFPAMVVRTFGGPAVNLQVFLDGDDTYWATSRSEGDEQGGHWHWPPRV